MKNLIYIFGLALVLSPDLILAQNQKECYNTVQFCPIGKRMGFTHNIQSYSGAFEMGDTSIVTIVVYKGMEYRFSLCSPSHPELNGSFEYKITELIRKAINEEVVEYVEKEIYNEDNNQYEVKQVPVTRKKRVYKNEEKVWYDNTEDEMSQEFIFQSKSTRKLNIKVYLPAGEEDDMNSGLSGSTYACVGLLIEHQPGIISGFTR
tara:strand:- start:471 stop:1085 length:615 start_codon:yes stop_codon:yes gene_type:complete